jgi:hypothetical protein
MAFKSSEHVASALARRAVWTTAPAPHVESASIRPAHLRMSADHAGSAWAMGVGSTVTPWNGSRD